MTKVYLPGETKEQRKLRKRKEKQSKLLQVDEIINIPSSIVSDTNYVCCLKWGNKYSAEYVNKLYSMVSRNLTIPHQFVCFTDDNTGLDKNIKTYNLPNLPVLGWWFKVWFLSDELPFTGTLLFLDLDLIVFRNIDNLFSYKPDNDFIIIRDFNRFTRSNYNKMNSSVFRIKIGSLKDVYQKFNGDITHWTKRLHGDQDFMFKEIHNHIFWPDEWIQSYKWEMRARHDLALINGKRNFRAPGIPVILDETSIAVFHGNPDIHDCVDEWPKNNWG
jgi:hypothetical protein